MLKVWNKISSKTIYRNDHWEYNLDEFEIESGPKGEYHYVHTNGSTMVIPITSQKEFILVKQYRYLNQRESIEFPCGSIEDEIDAEENAQKELREETGFSANKLIYVGEFSPYTGASDEMCKVYIGIDLNHSPLQSDQTEEFILEKYSFEKLQEAIETNVIWDGLTISAYAIAKRKILELL